MYVGSQGDDKASLGMKCEENSFLKPITTKARDSAERIIRDLIYTIPINPLRFPLSQKHDEAGTEVRIGGRTDFAGLGFFGSLGRLGRLGTRVIQPINLWTVEPILSKKIRQHIILVNGLLYQCFR